MSRKILLIAPPTFKMPPTSLPSFVEEESGDYPPLGLLYVAAYLRAFTDHTVDVLDSSVEGLTYEDIRKRVAEIRPDIVGIQVTTFTLLDAISVAKEAKAVSKDIHVCFGGIHTTLYPKETLELDFVDSLVIGEGERPFAELVNALDKNKPLGGIPGIAYKDKGNIFLNSAAPLISDLDSLPFPARDLVPYEKYESILSPLRRLTTMVTSRGCPFKCVFCNRAHFGKVCRFATAEYVVNEMQECKEKFGIDEILIYDDTFTLDRGRAMRICDLLAERKMGAKWDIRTRVDLVDEELMKKLKKAGCERIHFGVESGAQKFLDILHKGITLGQAEAAFKMAKKNGIKTLAYFMIGVPSETEGDVLDTIDFAIKLDADFLHLSVVTPFPDTDLYRMGLEGRVFENDYWREFAAAPAETFIPKIWDRDLTQESLSRLIRYGYKKYYLRPRYIMKRIISAGSLSALRKQAAVGMKLLKNCSF